MPTSARRRAFQAVRGPTALESTPLTWPGYYTAVPQDQIGTTWMPTLESAGAGIAAARFHPARAPLMGVSAARVHGALPRALAVAIVAAPTQHESIALLDRAATVRFVKRDGANRCRDGTDGAGPCAGHVDRADRAGSCPQACAGCRRRSDPGGTASTATALRIGCSRRAGASPTATVGAHARSGPGAMTYPSGLRRAGRQPSRSSSVSPSSRFIATI